MFINCQQWVKEKVLIDGLGLSVVQCIAIDKDLC